MAEVKTNNQSGYSLWNAIVKPLWAMSDNLWLFLAAGTAFSLLMTLLALIFSQTFLCVFKPEMAQLVYCSEQDGRYLPYLILKIVLIAMFITVWNTRLYHKQKESEIFSLEMLHNFIGTFFIFIAFIVINLIPALSGYLLFVRVPNPVWQIELGYFTVVAVGFLAPFILMRLYANVSEWLNGEKWDNFAAVWVKTRGRGFKIVFSTTVMFLISAVLILSVTSGFKPQSPLPSVRYDLAMEWVFNLVTLFIVALMVNYIQTQKEIILGHAD